MIKNRDIDNAPTVIAIQWLMLNYDKVIKNAQT